MAFVNVSATSVKLSRDNDTVERDEQSKPVSSSPLASENVVAGDSSAVTANVLPKHKSYNKRYECGDNWWKKTVIYEVYVRSFHDSNDDGVGDLKG